MNRAARLEDPWYDADHDVRRVRPMGTVKWCGEYYLDEATSTRVLAMGEEAVHHQEEVEVRRHAA